MSELSARDVRSRRVARSHLAGRAPAAALADVVAGVGGIQAQDPGAAGLGLSARVQVTRDDVRSALAERRTLVRTWGVRGTMHLLPAGELSLWMAALSVEPFWEQPAWREKHGLREREVGALLAAIGDALAGRELSREELGDAVAAQVGSGVREALMSGWGELLAPAGRLGLLCHGPGRDGRATFVRADEWVGGWPRHDPREALAEVFRRFLRAYGPARVADFERWCGVRLPEDVAARVDVTEVRVGRRRALVLAGDVDVAAPEPPVRLLPRYDCYLLGSYPREGVVPAEHGPRLRAHPRGRFEGAAGHSTLLVDGAVAGVWEHRDGTVRVEPYVELGPRDLAALESEAERVAAFHGTEGTLSLGPLL